MFKPLSCSPTVSCGGYEAWPGASAPGGADQDSAGRLTQTGESLPPLPVT